MTHNREGQDMDDYEDYMDGDGSGPDGLAPCRPCLTTVSAWGTSYRKGSE